MPFQTKAVTATEAGVQAVPDDPTRTSVSFFNLTASRVSVLDVSADRAETEGFPLAAGVGNLTFNWLSGSDPTARYFLKSASGAGDLVIRVLEEWGVKR